KLFSSALAGLLTFQAPLHLHRRRSNVTALAESSLGKMKTNIRISTHRHTHTPQTHTHTPLANTSFPPAVSVAGLVGLKKLYIILSPQSYAHTHSIQTLFPCVHTHTHTHTHTGMHTHINTFSLSHTLCHSYTYTLSLLFTLTHTHTHTHTVSHTHKLHTLMHYT